MDAFINWLRQTDGEPHDNRSLARIGWVIITLAGLLGVFLVVDAVWVPAGTSTGNGHTALQELAKVTFTVVSVWIFAASLLWPARKLEAWLDDRYPEHAVEEDLDYSLRNDLLASTWLGGLWSFRFAVAYAVISILAMMLSVLNAMDESGYPLDSADVTQLTVLNSFAIATLTTLLAGVAFFWLINWSMKDIVAAYNTPANNTLGALDPAAQEVATDGGEDGGA